MKKCFKIILAIGLIVLTLLDLVAFAGIVYGLVKWDLNILSVSCSVFTAATSSILTIIALIMTFYFQKKDFEYKINESQVQNRKAINKVLDTLSLQNIFVKKFLVPNPITQINKSGSENKDNLKISFVFYSQCLNEIQNIGIRYMKLACDYFAHNDKSFLIKFDENDTVFCNDIDRENNTLRLNIVTGLNLENYKSFTKYLDKSLDCALKINMIINILHSTGECLNKEIKTEKMNFERFDKKKGIYIFTRH